MQLTRPRRLGFARVLAALVVLFGATVALAHRHPSAAEPHAHAATQAHGPGCDHSHAAPPFDEPHGPQSDRDACSVCWAGATAGKALATSPPLTTPPLGVAAVGPGAPGDAPRFKTLRAAFEPRGPPAAIEG